MVGIVDAKPTVVELLFWQSVISHVSSENNTA